MSILTLHIIAIFCIIYLSYRYGVYIANKEVKAKIRYLRKIEKKLKSQPDPFFTRR
jgi:hypothetical protein